MCGARKIRLTFVLVAATLISVVSGCATTPVVNVSTIGAFPEGRSDRQALDIGPKTFAFEQSPTKISAEVVTGITQRLTEQGWQPMSPNTARYRVAIAYATRSADVGVIGNCIDGVNLCNIDSTDGQKASVFRRKPRYVHTLAIRFIDIKNRQWTYELICAVYDDDSEPDRALILLVDKAVRAF